MTIASAIAALSPSIWLKLDETSGTSAVNSGSRTLNGVYSGSFDQGLPGPETGTFATRLYAGGQVSIGPMDQSTLVDQTIAAWVSTDASGTTSTSYPFIGIGDVANRLARGPLIYEFHTVVGSTSWRARVNTGTSVVGNVPAPEKFWHWVALTVGIGTNRMNIYIDGILAATGTASTIVNAQLSDPLLVRSDQPVVVAHVCWFGGILTQAQLQTVSSQLAPWPYTVPINSPPPEPAGGGGGLTDDQAAQLSNIDTKTDLLEGMNTGISTLLSNWAGYTGTTLPSLQDMLNHLSAQSTDIQNTLNDFATGVLNYIQTTVTSIFDAVHATIPGPAGDVLDAIGHLFSPTSQDQIGLYDILGGPTCSNIDLDLSYRSYYGLQLTITTRPLHFWPSTPDNDWTIADLAVISIVVSGNLLARIPIHTSTWSLNGLPGGFPFKVADIGIPILPGGYHLKVEWAQGVCGKLELQYLPGVGPPGFPHFP